MRIQNIGNDNRSLSQNNISRKHTNFKRAWEEHISWGANYIAKTGKTNFKLFTFPDAKSVFVEVADKANVKLSNMKEKLVQVFGVAGAALTVTGIKSTDNKSKIYPMENKGEGIFEVKDIKTKPEDKYRYIIVTKDNDINIVKDPYAKKQENIHGWSSIYSSDNYKWKNTEWLNGKDSRRITRDPDDKKFHGLANLIIEEINIPTITKEGNFKSAKIAVDKIAEDGIANAIEIMPVENTYSKQWGYDGVDKFAINERLGSHVELKELIDYAHGKGLNVIIDMVPNHMGTDGDYLSQTGPYESGSTDWGAALNYEKANSKYVRDFMANAALWWANEFKADGLRLDMTKFANSDYLLKEIVDEVNEHNKNVFLIAEDARENLYSITKYDDSTNSHQQKIDSIDMLVDLIENGTKTYPQAVGFDSEWDFPFMHALTNAITHENPPSMQILDNTILNSNHRVKYILSHDEIGNNNGVRLIPKIMAKYMNYESDVNGNSNSERGQKAAHLSQLLFTSILLNKDITDEELSNIQKEFGVVFIRDKAHLINVLKTAFAKYRLATGTVMSIPGPKMFFQGEEHLDLSYFKFFRNFSPEFENYPPNAGQTEKTNQEKGYIVSNEYALKDSLVGQLKPTGEFKNIQEQILLYNQDLADLIKNHPPLQKGDLKSVYKDHDNMVHIHSLEARGEKLLVFKNYADKFHNGCYSTPGFPSDGKYIEIFNSDDTKYGGGGQTNKGREITADNQNITLTANTMIILKRV